MEKVVDKFVPVLFQKLDTFESEDSRFLKTKIWLCHTGENLNGSYFSKKVLEDAIPTLANTPILAYIEDNSDGEKDFSDHRMVLVKEDGDFKIKYIGQAIGIIPQDNNATFEKRLCDDGVEREFLTCEGLVWTKWDDPIDIFNRDQIKSQSMELHDDFTGEWGDDGLYHFTKISFFGACALGTDVQPAMRNATIEAQFSKENMFTYIQDKFEEFKQVFNKKEGGSRVDKKLLLLEKYSLTVEDLAKKEINIDEYSVEELEVKLKEFSDNGNPDGDNSPNEKFTLTGEQFRTELKNEIRKEKIQDDWGWEYSRYSYVDYKDNEVYAFDRKDNYKLFGFSFETNGDSIIVDFETKKRKKFEIVDFEEGVSSEIQVFPKEALEYETKVAEKKAEENFSAEKKDLEEKFTSLESETAQLREFKANKLAEERTLAENEIYERFTSELTEEEIADVKETASQFTLEQLEEKLFTLVGKKKATFSKNIKREKQSIKINLDNTENELSPYGNLFDKINK